MAQAQIRIRMYRVGFGDCFLVTFPGRRPAHVLVDCGVHVAGDINTLKLAVDDIAEVTGGKLALLVATHAHEDHIAGYAPRGSFQEFPDR
jgi:glyoxylase-like metal-dependent hydrolase (beta-lactamase superfamily II)